MGAGGGDPYIGKLMAMDAIKTRGDVTMFLTPEWKSSTMTRLFSIAMMEHPLHHEKGINGSECQTSEDMVSQFYGEKLAFFPIEAGGKSQ